MPSSIHYNQWNLIVSFKNKYLNMSKQSKPMSFKYIFKVSMDIYIFISQEFFAIVLNSKVLLRVLCFLRFQVWQFVTIFQLYLKGPSSFFFLLKWHKYHQIDEIAKCKNEGESFVLCNHLSYARFLICWPLLTEENTFCEHVSQR